MITNTNILLTAPVSIGIMFYFLKGKIILGRLKPLLTAALAHPPIIITEILTCCNMSQNKSIRQSSPSVKCGPVRHEVTTSHL